MFEVFALNVQEVHHIVTCNIFSLYPELSSLRIVIEDDHGSGHGFQRYLTLLMVEAEQRAKRLSVSRVIEEARDRLKFAA